jgi:hypothetical protein
MEGEISIPKVNSAFRNLGFAESPRSMSHAVFYDDRGSPSSDSLNHSKPFLEADMSDSVFDYPLRKQFSTSVLQTNHRLGISASHPNLLAKDDSHIMPRTPTPPFSASPEPATGLDITENGSIDKYLTLDPVDLANFRKWIVGFCIVNFDLEIGQGKYAAFGLGSPFFYSPLGYFAPILALDYAYPPMDLTPIEQKNM